MPGNDDVFAVLADEHRRSILRHLQETDDGVATVDELVADAVDLEAAAKTESVKALYYHATLPHLADSGYVEYDSRSQVVRYREHPLLNRVLRAATELRATP